MGGDTFHYIKLNIFLAFARAWEIKQEKSRVTIVCS